MRTLFPSLLALTALAATPADSTFRVYVTNEKAGTVTVIDPVSAKAVATITVGGRVRESSLPRTDGIST